MRFPSCVGMASTMMQWSVDTPDPVFKRMKYSQSNVPRNDKNGVLVKFHTASLNFRDLAVAKVNYIFGLTAFSYLRSDCSNVIL